jgi:2-(1,2-epoxy-1,2-dihydrophenyl)acetyl-CoA isomerase
MSDFSTVRYELRGAVALITLNRPEVLNAFNTALRADLLAAAERANADPAVRVVVLTGEGRAFSAGADLGSATLGTGVGELIETEYRPSLLAIAGATKPWIAAVNGLAAGIGGSYALSCDLVVMAEHAYIYQAFIAIALVPDGGATWHLVRQLGPKRAFEMIAEGEKMPAATCVALGLANRVVPGAEVLDNALAWAAALAEKAPLALRYSKEALREAMKRSLPEMISYEAALQDITSASQDAMEGVTAFLEKRKAVFTGR